MRFMLIVKANACSEAGVKPQPPLLAEVAQYHETLARAGVLLDAAGLKPSSQGWRVRHRDGQQQVIDGPFAETKELVAGYTLIQVRSRDEAIEWARRYPAPFGAGNDGELEVRPLVELDDFAPGGPAERFRDLPTPRG